MKKCLKSVLFALLFVLALRAAPVCAEAAVFRSVPLSVSGASDEGQRDLEKLKIGRGYFWIRDYELYYGTSKTAKGKKISNDTDAAVTDGNVIYFASRIAPKPTLYSYTVKNKKKRSIEKMNAYRVNVVGCVGGNVYLYVGDAQGDSVVRYNLKSRKASKKTPVEYRMDGMNSSYGKYATGWQMVYVGNNTYLEELYLHNLITGKGKRIGKNGKGGHLNTYLTKNKLFYEQVYYKKDPSTRQLRYRGTKIFSYDLKTGKEKAVTRMLKIYTITKLTSSSVTYMQEGTGKIKTVKFS